MNYHCQVVNHKIFGPPVQKLKILRTGSLRHNSQVPAVKFCYTTLLSAHF